MTDFSTMMSSLWNRYVNFETLFAVIVFIAIYQFVIKNEALYEFVGRLLIKLELRLTGNYDHVPIDGESIVSGFKTKASWELVKDNVSVFAVQGRRPHMEDRFNVVSPLENTGTSIFGIFDGHGGDFAADFVEKTLFKSIMVRLLKPSLKKQQSQSIDRDDHIEQQHENDNDINKDDLNKTPQNQENIDINNIKKDEKQQQQISHQSLKNRSLNKKIRKILREEILNVDKQLLDIEKTTGEISGSTLLLATIHNNVLIVANVGDSRGVLCDQDNKAIPLSFDHKPQLAAERKRIKRAGGFVSFNGVWRVAGILALSRAMGDYPLKEKNFVVAEPDILTFKLKKIKPKFMILATDGLWDVFSNEEAIQYISNRLHEPHLGAKSLVLQAYYRGSLDNISVMVVKFSYIDQDGGVGDDGEEEEEEDEEEDKGNREGRKDEGSDDDDDDDDDVIIESHMVGDGKLKQGSYSAKKEDYDHHDGKNNVVIFHLPTADDESDGASGSEAVDSNLSGKDEKVKNEIKDAEHKNFQHDTGESDKHEEGKFEGIVINKDSVSLVVQAIIDTNDDEKMNHWKVDDKVEKGIGEGVIRLVQDDVSKYDDKSGGDPITLSGEMHHDNKKIYKTKDNEDDKFLNMSPNEKEQSGEVSELIFVSDDDKRSKQQKEHQKKKTSESDDVKRVRDGGDL